MSHVWMRFTNIQELYHKCESVVSLSHMNDSCQIHEEVTSYIWISHVTHQNHTYECNRWGGLWDSTLHHTAANCSTLQHTATHSVYLHTFCFSTRMCCPRWRFFYHCKNLQHTVTHCTTLQHTTAHCNTLQHTAAHCNTLCVSPHPLFLDSYGLPKQKVPL